MVDLNQLYYFAETIILMEFLTLVQNKLML